MSSRQPLPPVTVGVGVGVGVGVDGEGRAGSTGVIQLPSWWRRRSPVFRFGVAGLSLMAAFYTAAYYPYAPAGVPGRALAGYVLLQARLCGSLLHLFDPTVSTTGALISGRFPLMIVLDCVAPDTLALYAAATLAFPAPVSQKLIGLVAGLVVLVAINLARVVLLYVVGVHWPHLFGLMHEEILQVVVVLSVACCFAAHVGWVRRRWGWPPDPSRVSRASAH